MVRTPLARRIERDAALNDVHLFLPHFDTQAVTSVVESLHNVEDVPPSETGSSRNLVVLGRRAGLEDVFAALGDLITYRVNAARAQSHLRRLMAISRSLTMDAIDDDAWDCAKRQIMDWMAAQIAAMKSDGHYDAAAQAITRGGLKTLAVKNGTDMAEPEADYHMDASDVDIDRLFEEAGRALSHGLHMT
jgi:type III restriction enzyme